MWAPFIELPLPFEPRLTTSASTSSTPAAGSAASKASDSERGASSRGDPPPTVIAGIAAKATLKAASGPPLRPGAVKVGVAAPCLHVSGLRISSPDDASGGRVLAGVSIVQDRAYWEVHVKATQPSARLLVGVAGRAAPQGEEMIRPLGESARSWGADFGSVGTPLQVGDIIGVAYDQAVFPVSIGVWRNSTPVSVPFARGLKGELWPALYLSGCTVDWALGEEHWLNASVRPEGFDSLMPSRGLIGD